MFKLPVISIGALGVIAIILAVIIVLVVIGYVVYLLLQKKKVQPKPEEEKKVPIKEVKVEEKKAPIKEAKVEEKKAPIKEEKPPVEEVKEEPKAAPVVASEEPKKEMFNYSFKSRLHLADKDTAERYNTLKNYLLKHEGVTNNLSWKQETFTVKGKMVVKIRLQGKTMRVYLGLDPKNYVGTKYNLVDESKSKTHESTPALLIVKGPRLLQYALELVDDYMKGNEIGVNSEYKAVDYKEKSLTQEKLIEMGLIKTQKAAF